MLEAEHAMEIMDETTKEMPNKNDPDAKLGDEDTYLQVLKNFQRSQLELQKSRPAGYQIETQLFTLNTVDRKEARQFILSEEVKT